MIVAQNVRAVMTGKPGEVGKKQLEFITPFKRIQEGIQNHECT